MTELLLLPFLVLTEIASYLGTDIKAFAATCTVFYHLAHSDNHLGIRKALLNTNRYVDFLKNAIDSPNRHATVQAALEEDNITLADRIHIISHVSIHHVSLPDQRYLDMITCISSSMSTEMKILIIHDKLPGNHISSALLGRQVEFQNCNMCHEIGLMDWSGEVVHDLPPLNPKDHSMVLFSLLLHRDVFYGVSTLRMLIQDGHRHPYALAYSIIIDASAAFDFLLEMCQPNMEELYFAACTFKRSYYMSKLLAIPGLIKQILIWDPYFMERTPPRLQSFVRYMFDSCV